MAAVEVGAMWRKTAECCDINHWWTRLERLDVEFASKRCLTPSVVARRQRPQPAVMWYAMPQLFS